MMSVVTIPNPSVLGFNVHGQSRKKTNTAHDSHGTKTLHPVHLSHQVREVPPPLVLMLIFSILKEITFPKYSIDVTPLPIELGDPSFFLGF